MTALSERWRAGPPLKVEVTSYLLIALAAISRALRPGWVVGDGVDAYGTLWFYWWIQDCIKRLRDPGFTDLFFYPMGKDIFAHTGNNFLDAVFAAPFYWLLGNLDYQPWFVAAVLVANALTFRVLARHVLGAGPAAYLATLAWMVNPYVLFEITCGRLTQAFLPFLPLAFYHLLRLEETGEGARPWRHALLAGLFTALQAWTYWFMGWFMAFAFTWLGIYGVWRSPRRGALVLRYGIAGAACLVFVAPGVWAMAGRAGAGDVPGLVEGWPGFAALLDPPPAQRNNVATHLYGLTVVETSGVPLLTAPVYGLAALGWLALGAGRARWAPAALLVLVMALGPAIGFHGPMEDATVMPHYMLAYYTLPFFERLWFPYRMLSVAFVPICLGLGFLFQGLAARRPRLSGAWPALALVFLGLHFAERSRFEVFPFVARDQTPPPSVAWLKEQGGAIIDMPFGIYKRSVIWQTFHELPTFGGMGENAVMLWPEGMRRHLRNSFIHACRRPEEPADYRTPQRALIEAEGFRWVILHRDLIVQHGVGPEKRHISPIGPVVQMANVLGPPTAVDGPLVIWDLTGAAVAPEGMEPTEARMYGDVMVGDPRPAYEIALEEAGRLERGGEPGKGGRR
jgi:hypothetical protein